MRGSPRSWGVFDLASREVRIAALDKVCSAPDLWNDRRAAESKLRELAGLREEVTAWREMESTATNLEELAALAVDESDDSIKSSLAEELRQLSDRLGKREFALQLSGEFDERGAIIAIKQGAGGVEAQDWVQMLLRMYLRWAEQRGYETRVLDSSPGEEAGLKSAVVRVDGRYVYGHLKAERGVHRLVRLSPFDADHQRHTSFALVEVLPEADPVEDVTISPDDLKIDTFRASGHGGQNVQKNASAVRLTHLPTGITVSVQNERSQAQNKEIALGILHARLVDRDMQRRAKERAKLKGDHISPEWGNQARSYVLHPYHLVKDHRTGQETSDTAAVLNGEIQPFLQAYLLSTVT